MIGEKLKFMLEMKGITQRELAQKLGTTEVTVSRYINNTRDPKSEMIVKICRVFDISADWLLEIKKSGK